VDSSSLLQLSLSLLFLIALMPVVPAERRQPAVLTQTMCSDNVQQWNPYTTRHSQAKRNNTIRKVQGLKFTLFLLPARRGLPGPLLHHVHSLIPPVLL
jgi:hypothetical protein